MLVDAGVVMLERSSTILTVDGTSVGVAGVKGFVGGFGSTWPNFGEPLFRQAYAETTADVEALDAALKAIAACDVRVALLHYAPISETLVGEPERLWLVLGAERLARPLVAHRPDLVLHQLRERAVQRHRRTGDLHDVTRLGDPVEPLRVRRGEVHAPV